MHRKLRMGMVGGGKDAFIGAIHRIAAQMDGLIEVTSGALVFKCMATWAVTLPRPDLSV